MVVIGIGLVLLGVLAVLAAIFVSVPGTGGEILGVGVTTMEAFLIGVAAGAAILWGFGAIRWGTKRGLAHRRERKELQRLNAKLERVEAEDKERKVDEA